MSNKIYPNYNDLVNFKYCLTFNLHLSDGDVYSYLANISDRSTESVKRMFFVPGSRNYNCLPYADWRLWNLVIYNIDVAEYDQIPTYKINITNGEETDETKA